MSTEIRVRFAPAPTGNLHIGGVRTALYNYLFAKKNKGKFILRIEDTDKERSLPEYLDSIINSLRWMGLEWDEGPGAGGRLADLAEFNQYYQSKRAKYYERALEHLIKMKKVYKCFCTPEELKIKREICLKAGKDPGYDGRCLKLSDSQREEFKHRCYPFAYRLKTPESGTISFKDIIKGDIEIDLATINDFVITKSGGSPAYNFACAVDDGEMHISHVIRGDDHIYNTPKQILIYKALDWSIPEYAHLPQVHGTDGKKLSKRTGAVSVEEYKDKGYLPEAINNYLALIGWSTEDSQQLFEWEELIEKFELKRCSTSCGIFDIEKLNWMNGKYMRSMEPKVLAQRAMKWLKYTGVVKDEYNIPDNVIKAIGLEQEKFEFLTDIPDRIDFMVRDDIEYDEKAVEKRLKKEGARDILEAITAILQDTQDFTAVTLENRIKEYCEKNELGAGKVFHPVRVAVSGRAMGPGLFEILEFIGKERSIQRISHALDKFVE
ncbi:glutamate--tRNA ligase [Elusimicrobiota bacterium]